MDFDRLRLFYRSCLFRIVVVGLVAFCEPGIWTALNNLGAGGNAKVGDMTWKLCPPEPAHPFTQPCLSNAGNSLTYGLMSVGCSIAGAVTNKISAKWTLFIGAAFYTPYAAGLYCNNRYGNEWFLLWVLWHRSFVAVGQRGCNCGGISGGREARPVSCNDMVSRIHERSVRLRDCTDMSASGWA